MSQNFQSYMDDVAESKKNDVFSKICSLRTPATIHFTGSV